MKRRGSPVSLASKNEVLCRELSGSCAEGPLIIPYLKSLIKTHLRDILFFEETQQRLSGLC
ncbi:hypothetical protein Syun_014589 [Stephania yunnanensis]|uniref:Uncharacterized protein n=1 Tax=Stephania yunnanensis TaxID=152371 RepID=A0AAP0JK37_9MAGN